jgi:hypothetical protein
MEIWHFRKLFDMRLKSKLPTFISNFLSNRAFNSIYSTYSNIQEQEMGAPQGSILSVILFSIKVNSLAKVLNDNFLGKNMIIIKGQVQLCLNQIENFVMVNGFKLSS